MTPFHTEPRFTLYVGNSLDVLPTLPPSSVDSIVSDPPYGLSFMGKDWDHGVPGEAFWREALRVAKPGAHLLAFGGTRTFHRLAVAIEDAGWEIRDCVMWVYGSGFPKSLDVSKAIDKRGGRIADFNAFRDDLRRAMAAHAITRKELQDRLGNHMLSHYLTNGVQPAIPTLRDYKVLRDALKLGDRWDDLFLEEADREVVGTAVGAIVFDPGNRARHTVGGHSREYSLTAPATAEARAWEGWGTALKPAWEPVIVARKPLEGTVAENVLKYGTGVVNVDGCRVGGEEGRWPANVIHDGSEEVVEMFPDDNGGSAARFFYCAKAGKADRDDGEVVNHHPTVKPTDLMRYLVRLVTPVGGVVLDPFMGSGSTGRGALLEGCRFIGIDLSDDYATIARERIAACAAEPSLFDAVS